MLVIGGDARFEAVDDIVHPTLDFLARAAVIGLNAGIPPVGLKLSDTNGDRHQIQASNRPGFSIEYAKAVGILECGGRVIGVELLVLPNRCNNPEILGQHFFKERVADKSQEVTAMGERACSILLEGSTKGQRQDVSRLAEVRAVGIVAPIFLGIPEVVGKTSCPQDVLALIGPETLSRGQAPVHANRVLQRAWDKTGLKAAPERAAIVPAITPGSAKTKFEAEILGEKGCLGGVVGSLEKRPAQLSPLGRYLHASAPDVEIPVELQLAYCIEDVVRHPGTVARMGVVAEKTLGIDFKFHVLVYLPIHVKTGIVDDESFVEPVRRLVPGPPARSTETHAQRHPPLIIDRILRPTRELDFLCVNGREHKVQACHQRGKRRQANRVFLFAASRNHLFQVNCFPPTAR